MRITPGQSHNCLDSGDFHINLDPFGLIAATAPFYFNQDAVYDGTNVLAQIDYQTNTQFRVNIDSGYTGAGTLFLADDGNYKAAGTTINPSDNYLPVRTSSATFGNSPLHVSSSGSTNIIIDGQLIWGPGDTNVLYRSGASLVATNGSTTNAFTLRNGLGTGFHMTFTSGGAPRLLTDNGFIWMGGTTVLEANLIPDSANTRSIGTMAAAGSFADSVFQGTHYIVGSNDSGANYTRLAINHTGNAGDIQYKSDALGTQTFRPHVFQIGSTNVAKIDTTSAAGETRFWLYDEDNGTMERVTVGAADSGGVGFKLLRIPN